MEYIFFCVFLLLLCRVITKVPFVKNAGLDNRTVVLLFLLKVIAGLAIGWITVSFFDIRNDYWNMNEDAWKEYQLLLHHPREYFMNITETHYAKGYAGFFDALPSYWNDLRNTIISKLLAPFNLLSRGNYYINSLFFNFFCFMGHIAFYRIFIQLYADRKTAVIICCFLLPSMLYFTSGIQKDGIVFSVLGVLCYTVFKALQEGRFTAKRTGVVFFSLLLLFFIRSYVPILITPALLIWIAVVKYKLPPLVSFTAGYILAAVLFFNLEQLTGNFNPLEAVTKKQEAFFMLPKAATEIKLDTLYPNFKSFAHNVPQAFNHSLLRPYLTELPSKSILPLNIETLLYLLAFLLFLFFRYNPDAGLKNPFTCFGVFFSMSMLLFIGYIVPNLGSIVRYRSIYLIFLVTPIFCGLDLKKVLRALKIKK